MQYKVLCTSTGLDRIKHRAKPVYGKTMRVLISVFIVLSVALVGRGNASVPTGAANISQLAKDPVWLTLLHFEEKGSGGQASSIVSEAFFVSERGPVSAEAELQATIDAFLNDVEPGNTDASSAMQCRFPARLQWLRSKVLSLKNLEPVVCDDFEEWLGETEVESVSIVFAAGHMKSPASYFGHNFLKFNSGANGNFLLDQSVNYGADVPPEHGPLPYLYNGISGGYLATYETQQFVRHMASYGEEDLRDLWEYKLDLTGEEVKLLLLHAWELKNQQLSYYFFRENCAYHIARLLGLATAELFVPRYMPWTMPYNVMSRLAEVNRNGEPLVEDIIYHPSRRSRFRRGFFSMSSQQKEQVRSVIDSEFPDIPLPLDDENRIAAGDYNLNNGDSHIQIVDTLLDYYEMLIRVNEDDVAAKEAKRQLLLKRLSYPPSPDNREMTETLSPPHLASKPGYVGLGYFSNTGTGEALELGVRPAYFDYLSDNIGRSNIGNFALLDTRLRFTDERIRLHSLSIMDIANLVPSSTGITGDRATSWRFRAGLDQTNNACESCLRPMLDWQIGRTWGIKDNLSFFALTGLRLQSKFKRDTPLVLKTTLGVTGRLNNNVKMLATVSRHEDTGSDGLDRNPVNVQFRFHEHSSWDVRLHYLRDVAEEVGIAFGIYW